MRVLTALVIILAAGVLSACGDVREPSIGDTAQQTIGMPASNDYMYHEPVDVAMRSPVQTHG